MVTHLPCESIWVYNFTRYIYVKNQSLRYFPHFITVVLRDFTKLVTEAEILSHGCWSVFCLFAQDTAVWQWMDVDDDTDVKLKRLFAEGHTHNGVWPCNEVVAVSNDVIVTVSAHKKPFSFTLTLWCLAACKHGNWNVSLDANVS